MSDSKETKMAGNEDYYHPAVRLLLARMESNPEEFEKLEDYDALALPDPRYQNSRWDNFFARCKAFATEAETEALTAKLNSIRMNVLHHELMDELCNGEERREQARRAEQEAQMKYAAQLAGAQYSNPISPLQQYSGSVFQSQSAQYQKDLMEMYQQASVAEKKQLAATHRGSVYAAMNKALKK